MSKILITGTSKGIGYDAALSYDTIEEESLERFTDVVNTNLLIVAVYRFIAL
jgi:hypothetical protein